MALDVAVSQAPVEGAVLWPVGRGGCWSTEVDYRVNVQQDRDGDETPGFGSHSLSPPCRAYRRHKL
jgi:hypothetical protein